MGAAAAAAPAAGTCGLLQTAFDHAKCCSDDSVASGMQVRAMSTHKMTKKEGAGTNVCHGTKPAGTLYANGTATGYANFQCYKDGVIMALSQAGTDVSYTNSTHYFTGTMRHTNDSTGANITTAPINTTLFEAGLCPVNVHWHLGTEHRSNKEYDENGKGPQGVHRRRTNPCHGNDHNPHHNPKSGYDNFKCSVNGVIKALEQAGTDVSVGYKGSMVTAALPTTTTLAAAGLCPVNVHWHLGAEHRSLGQFDENGKGPASYSHAANPCAGKKPASPGGFDNFECMHNDVVSALEQAGTDVTIGYKGGLATNATPIMTLYNQTALCPVNVHWHLGAEHRSAGQYDETGVGPKARRLATAGATVRLGMRCKHYLATDVKFTKPYAWQYCSGMKVGETYEVHWPHSAAGACGTQHQYQSPFYDGVFCRDGIISSTAAQIGVQAQIFTIVNDETYYNANMFKGMLFSPTMGLDIASYTGSTTGTSRSNKVCSKYSPITWQVDRHCHLISASSFDKLCADMKLVSDDMSGDMHPHGARELVKGALSATNHGSLPVGTHAADGLGGYYTAAQLAAFNAAHRRRARRLSEDEGNEDQQMEELPEPAPIGGEFAPRRLASAGKTIRQGLRCHHYDVKKPMFTKEYHWKHCIDMNIGETYEIHWPHSTAGACGTDYQYQTPFYDGVFCRAGKLVTTQASIGVQSQVFTIVNDEAYYYADLIKGMIVDKLYGLPANIAKYTGSTTGTSRSNTICSKYAPITWQVDRLCHLISASSFDKLCQDMKAQKDDMWHDLYAHGARELVANKYAANNHVRRLEEEEDEEGVELSADEVRHVRGANVLSPNEAEGRRLAGVVRKGMRCHKYDAGDKKFVVEYKWQHCVGMHVGETYEVHWPHSKAGACNTPNQFQSPFYDGVFCHGSKLKTTYGDIGVQAQIFTIVNDDTYYYPDLMYGMIVDGDMGKFMAKYTGSTTGTSRNNVLCSKYSPITWQVDRKCHLISASSFDKMCADMKAQRDDMSSDLHAHGSRELVAKNLSASNHVYHNDRPYTDNKRLLEADDMDADKEELQIDDKADDVIELDMAADKQELQSDDKADDVVDSLEDDTEERRLATVAAATTEVFTARRRRCAVGICSRVTLKLGGVIQHKGPGECGKHGWLAWEKWMNDKTSKDCIMDHDGSCVRVKITWMQRNTSDPLNTKMNHSKHIAHFTGAACGTMCADVLIAPYSSAETLLFIAAMPTFSLIPVMVWGGADPAIFTACKAKKLKCFGTLPSAETYTASSLDMIAAHDASRRRRGSTSRRRTFKAIAGIASKTGFGKSVHKGTKAWATAKKKTFTERVLDLSGGHLSANDKTALTALIAAKPEVIAIAGHPAEVQATIQEVRRLDTGHYIKAIVATNAWSRYDHLLQTETVGVLNGVIMPDPLDPRAEWPNVAYGITDATFKTLVGSGHANYHSASAFASGLAITEALKHAIKEGKNPCKGKKPTAAAYNNFACKVGAVVKALAQAGIDVTKVTAGGSLGTNTQGQKSPITTTYALATPKMCPVNVHWHLGAEHQSTGQYDAKGVGPAAAAHRRLSATARQGLKCHLYKATDAKFTTPYAWKHCKGMQVGATYEIHWPHSAAGACNTGHQYQTPFYDGVFCIDGALVTTQGSIGVQAQVFVVVNPLPTDKLQYYDANLFKGMIVSSTAGVDVAKYTGSTTGTSRSNTVCSAYAPITWQVDRTCHLISASSFDKLCADMKGQHDDMIGDVEAHGARELVSKELAAGNMVRRLGGDEADAEADQALEDHADLSPVEHQEDPEAIATDALLRRLATAAPATGGPDFGPIVRRLPAHLAMMTAAKPLHTFFGSLGFSATGQTTQPVFGQQRHFGGAHAAQGLYSSSDHLDYPLHAPLPKNGELLKVGVVTQAHGFGADGIVAIKEWAKWMNGGHAQDYGDVRRRRGNSDNSRRRFLPTKFVSNVKANQCAGTKPKIAAYDNKACQIKGVINALEQAGIDVTKGYVGNFSTSAWPINTTYWEAGLCPVNVHWHLGTEHRSAGQYDEKGVGPRAPPSRRLAANARQGLRCHHYDESDSKFTTAFAFQHCVGMKVGETYEVHWPHSKAGACGEVDQYQSPFYDGVFCKPGVLKSTYEDIGVHAQIFTIVNDESYYYADMIRGMIVDGKFGYDVARYTGSTTGTSRSNTMCSAYAPITWQVDRRCHLISASSFDKMCADMKAQRDDMSSDLYAHGSRELVAGFIASNNLASNSWNNRRLEGQEETEGNDDKPEEADVETDENKDADDENMDDPEDHEEKEEDEPEQVRRLAAAAAAAPAAPVPGQGFGLPVHMTFSHYAADDIKFRQPFTGNRRRDTTGGTAKNPFYKMVDELFHFNCTSKGHLHGNKTQQSHQLDKKFHCNDVVVAPSGSVEAKNFILAISALKPTTRFAKIPVMIYGGADETIETACKGISGGAPVLCYNMFAKPEDYAIPALDAVLLKAPAMRLGHKFSYQTIGMATGWPVQTLKGVDSWMFINRATTNRLGKAVVIKDVKFAYNKSYIEDAVSHKPDVVIIAAEAFETQDIIRTIRNKYQPRAIIATHAWSKHNLLDNGVNDLHGVIMPDQWEASECVADPVTGWTTKDFEALMTGAHGNANYHSASAMAGMIAVASSLKHGIPGDQINTLNHNMANFKLLKTFYGPISFNKGRIKKPMYAQQRHNLPGGHYQTKDVHVAGAVYPMPKKWETLNIYGMIQMDGEGAKGKHAFELWADWANQVDHPVPQPKPGSMFPQYNYCEGTKPRAGFDNFACMKNGVVAALEQAGTDVTVGATKTHMLSAKQPITDPYFKAGLCPVNVHWHLGAEHRSAGEYDETGVGPGVWGKFGGRATAVGDMVLHNDTFRRTAALSPVRLGLRCKKYTATNTKFTTEYPWQHCVGMKVGETYEVHWPHSKLGACGTVNQYQSPFYDGVFCHLGSPQSTTSPKLTSLNQTNTYIGVQAQVFTIINDENYYYPDLIRGMIVDGTDKGFNVAKYTGSTTGTSRSNTICSAYAPITWQVDRKCHLLSASSFDKMCSDMKAQRDDMSSDMHAHGSRELVSANMAANNMKRRLQEDMQGRRLSSEPEANENEEVGRRMASAPAPAPAAAGAAPAAPAGPKTPAGVDFTPNVFFVDTKKVDYHDIMKTWADTSIKESADILIAPYGNEATSLFLKAVPSNSPIPIMLWAGTNVGLFSDECASRKCFGMLTTGADMTPPILDAILKNAKHSTKASAREEMADAKKEHDAAHLVKLTALQHLIDAEMHHETCPATAGHAPSTSGAAAATARRRAAAAAAPAPAAAAEARRRYRRLASTPAAAPPAAAATGGHSSDPSVDHDFVKITMAVIKNKDDFSGVISDGATAWAGSQKKEVELLEEIHLEAHMSHLTVTDLSHLDALLDKKPDVIVVAGQHGDIEETIKKLRSRRLSDHYEPKAIVAVNAWSSLSTWQSMNDFTKLRGVIMPDQWGESALDRDAFTGWTVKDFKDKMKAGGHHANWPSASAFSTMSVIANAMKHAPQGDAAMRKSATARRRHAANFVEQLENMRTTATHTATPAQTIFGHVDFKADGQSSKHMVGKQFVSQDHSTPVPPFHDLKYPMESDAPCKCKFQGMTLAEEHYTAYPLHYPVGCEALFSCEVEPGQYAGKGLVGVYGSMCAAWDSMPQTPLSGKCAGHKTEDYGKPEYNWCQQPWCYVDKTCPDAQPTNVFHGNDELFYSYQTCGHYADCYTWTLSSTATVAAAHRRLSPAPAPAADGDAVRDPNTPHGCPYDPYMIPKTPLSGSEDPEEINIDKHYYPKHYTVFHGGDCGCMYAQAQLPDSLTSKVGDFPYKEYVGTTCAAWDQMPGTPSYEFCPHGSDWCMAGFNYCQAPWCFVSKDCNTKIASEMYGDGIFYSYATCLHAPDCRPTGRRLASTAAAPEEEHMSEHDSMCPFDYSAISWVTAKECDGYAVAMDKCMDIKVGDKTPYKGVLSHNSMKMMKGVVSVHAGQFCPIISTPKVKIALTLNGINFDDLMANPIVMSGVKDTCCVAFTTAMGVSSSLCDASVSAGSVKVEGAISIPSGTSSAAMSAAAGASNLAETLTSAVSSVPGIDAVAYGNIGVSDLAVSVVMVETTVAPAPVLTCRAPDAGLTSTNTDAASITTFLACLKAGCENYAAGHHRAARRLASAPAAAVAQVDMTTDFCSHHTCGAVIDTSALAAGKGTDTYTAKFGIVSGIVGRDLCPKKCGMCVSVHHGATPTPTRGQPTPMPTPMPSLHANGMATIITLGVKLMGVTFNELKDNPSIRSEFLAAVKGGILGAANLNKTDEITLLMAAGSVNVLATISPPAGEEFTYLHLCKKGMKKVAGMVAASVQAVPNIDSVGTGTITVQVTQHPELTQLPASSFNSDFGQVAVERDYINLGMGQCRAKNAQMGIPARVVFTDAANDCRRLCNERLGCFGFTSNAVFENTVDEDTTKASHSATGGTGPCVLWMESGLAADGFDEYDGNCFVKKAFCSIGLVCPEGACGQCSASNNGENLQTDADDVPLRTCAAEVCDPETDNAVCCTADYSAENDEDTDGALLTTAPGLFVLVVSIVGSLFMHLN